MQQTSERKQNKIQNNKGGFSMFKKMKHMKNEKGLTLVELLAVIVILAIVAAIAIPSIGNIIDNQRVKAVKADAAYIISAAQLYYADNGSSAAPFTVIPATKAGDPYTGTGVTYIDLGNSSITATVTVNSSGQITGGTIEKNGKELVITAATSLLNLQIDSTSKAGTAWTID